VMQGQGRAARDRLRFIVRAVALGSFAHLRGRPRSDSSQAGSRLVEGTNTHEREKDVMSSQASINCVTLVGHLTADPELRALPSGEHVCQMRLACNRPRRSMGGSYETRPNYFSVRVFGEEGETVHGRLRKGGTVAVDGRLEWREWETADREKRDIVTIVADEVQVVG
jgi:single-strand DNA-binding protein